MSEKPKLTLITSANEMPALEVRGCELKYLRVIRKCVLNNYTPSEDYKKKQPVQPFLQGYEESFGGWVLVEFWAGTEEDHKVWLEHVSASFDTHAHYLED